ncbi:alpha/beta hydrolase [Lactobacillus delbrueckii subsp. bulgaricus]|nr:alpha/beta hydrolase [Lactobacillus delbrueckii subsp. bulgaricus]MBT8989620.1 alpha/beta hydrolase [Lactobacillus delbrueckii subsp. bulgaricus]MBT9029539.1 alpha/beta hydrolase [Lactobacillus delbrueckii subsp. bulgaricus]
MLFFNSKKYAEETEKKRGKNPDPRDHSLAMMFFLGILATFPPFRIFLKLRGKRVSDLAENQASGSDQVPIIYVHGFRGGDYTTRMMVEDALKQKGDARFLKVEADLTGRIKLTGCYTGDKQPIIQLTFKDRIAGYQAINYYLSFILPFLSKKYVFTRYSAVAHSLGSPCVVATEMRYAKRKNFPHLASCALIAGPFNGVMYLGDIPNVNRLTESGRPSMVTPHYSYMLRHRRDFSPSIRVLNIYGNVLDTTNSDRFISVVSAKSIRYILAPDAVYYQEVEVLGDNAEHSQMHDEPFVIGILNRFLGLDKIKKGL